MLLASVFEGRRRREETTRSDEDGRSGFSGLIARILTGEPVADLELRAPEGVVTVMVAIAGVLTCLLLVYLVAALLKPEWFS